MKKTSLIIIAALTLCVSALAQTNMPPSPVAPTNLVSNPTISGALQEGWDALTTGTNFAFVAGAGRGLVGNKTVYFGDMFYNLNQNAALVLGGDVLHAPGINNANIVKGGLQLQAAFYPFPSVMPKLKVTPFAGYLVATPTGGNQNNGGIGAIAYTGVDWHYEFATSWFFHVGMVYQNRTGEGTFDGNYGCLYGAVGYHF